MIRGIEDIARTKRSAVLAFIADKYDLEDAINIEEEDGDIIIINEDRFFVITTKDEYALMNEVNTQRFEEAFSNLSAEQLNYVNEDAWLDAKGIQDFEDYLRDILEETPEFIEQYEGFNFYEL